MDNHAVDNATDAPKCRQCHWMPVDKDGQTCRSCTVKNEQSRRRKRLLKGMIFFS